MLLYKITTCSQCQDLEWFNYMYEWLRIRFNDKNINVKNFNGLRNTCFIHIRNPIGDVMVSVCDSSAVYRGFESRLGQTKDSNFYFCASPLNTHQKSRYWLAQNQDNVSEWEDMSIHRLLFHWASTIKILLSVLV
jgi:hypothetical protein